MVGEGRSDHGVSGHGPDLAALPKGKRRGCAGVVVERVLAERLRRGCEILCWRPVDRSGPQRIQQPPSPREVVLDENLLPRFLDKLLNPVQRQPEGPKPADSVVIAVDANYAAQFRRTMARLGTSRPDLARRTVAVVFDPEIEAILVQSKHPLEVVCELSPCSSQPPKTSPDPKLSLQDWLNSYAQGRRLDAELMEGVASQLDINANSYLDPVKGWLELVNGLAAVSQRKWPP